MKNISYYIKPNPVPMARIFFLVLSSLIVSSCKKAVMIGPPASSLVSENVYNNDAGAASVMAGLYSNMMILQFTQTMDLNCGMQADELTGFQGQSYYTNSLNSSTDVNYWVTDLYPDIFITNSVIEGLNATSGTTPAIKKQLIAEAQFMRAFFYFYLVNLYGDVPLITSAKNYQANAVAARTPTALVYAQIVTDLKDAQSNLSSNYLAANASTVTQERVIPNSWAATALLARVYLYMGDYKDAEIQASAVIANTSTYTLVTDLNSVFLANSNEAIWQLQPVSPGYNTNQAFNYILTSTPDVSAGGVAISPNLESEFEPGDKRKADWTGTFTADSITYYNYPYKYKVNLNGPTGVEYLMVLRLAEQFLIRAEARTQLGEDGGVADLNVIRKRAGLLNYASGTDKASLLTAILRERQVELFTEWGHRWLDLKRTGNVNPVMSVVTLQKGGTWNPDWQLDPIPLTDIQLDNNLKQNPGY